MQGKSFRSSEHFALKCKSFEEWCAKHGQTLPKQMGETQEEKSLGAWLVNKLVRFRQGKLSVDQQTKLSEIPAVSELFSVPGKSFRSEPSAVKCKNFEDWCAQHSGALPKRNGNTQEERSLAFWFKNKHFRYQRGKLTDDQLAQLRKIPAFSEVFSVPGKSFRSQHFAVKCKSFEDWCAHHSGALPKRNGNAQEERSLAIWLKDKLFSYRCGKLSDDQLARLRAIPEVASMFESSGT